MHLQVHHFQQMLICSYLRNSLRFQFLLLLALFKHLFPFCFAIVAVVVLLCLQGLSGVVVDTVFTRYFLTIFLKFCRILYLRRNFLRLRLPFS